MFLSWIPEVQSVQKLGAKVDQGWFGLVFVEQQLAATAAPLESAFSSLVPDNRENYSGRRTTTLLQSFCAVHTAL
jgi:hypothetical protein